MIVIDKTYTITFSYAGIKQTANFNEKDGKILNPRLFVNYGKVGEIPDISNMTDIKEILDTIKAFSYCNQAEITHINSLPIKYYKNKKARKAVDSFIGRFEAYVQSEALIFFQEIVEPIMVKKGWVLSYSSWGIPILIKKNSNGEWDNINHKDSEEIDYILERFLSAFSEDNRFPVGAFFGLVDYDMLKNKGLYLETPE